jgi:hypothetical protein
MQLLLGRNLEILEKSMREMYVIFFEELGHDGLLLWHTPRLQHVVNMRKDHHTWEHIGSLSGEIVNEATYFQQVEKERNSVLKSIALRMKAQEAAFFGLHDLAVSILDELESLGGGGIRFSCGAPNGCWLAARANLQHLFYSTGQCRRLRKGRKYMKILQLKWMTLGVQTLLHT